MQIGVQTMHRQKKHHVSKNLLLLLFGHWGRHVSQKALCTCTSWYHEIVGRIMAIS